MKMKKFKYVGGLLKLSNPRYDASECRESFISVLVW